MIISISRHLRHMKWANQRVFSAVSLLPDSALDSYIVNPEWSARHILQHIVSGADWFVYRLTGTEWSDIKIPTTMADVAPLADTLSKRDHMILGAAELTDEEITQTIEGKSETYFRSTMLMQAIHHATEHRAQLIDALEYKGFKPINLDGIDLWAFENFERADR